MDKTNINKLPLNDIQQFETRIVLKKTVEAHRYLAELKGIASRIPNEAILLNTLSIQEAKDRKRKLLYEYELSRIVKNGR